MIYNPVAWAQCPSAVCVQLSDAAVSGGVCAAPSHRVQSEPQGRGVSQDHCLCEAGLVSARVRGLPLVLLCDPLMPAGGWCCV